MHDDEVFHDLLVNDELVDGCERMFDDDEVDIIDELDDMVIEIIVDDDDDLLIYEDF